MSAFTHQFYIYFYLLGVTVVGPGAQLSSAVSHTPRLKQRLQGLRLFTTIPSTDMSAML